LGIFLLANLFYSYPLPSLKSNSLEDKNGQLISGIKTQSYENSSEIPENLTSENLENDLIFIKKVLNDN